MVPDNSGRVERLIAIQSRLKSSEERFRKLFDNLGDEVHLWKLVRDEKGDIITWELVDVNPSAIKAWSRTKEQVVGRKANDIFGSDVTNQFLATVKEIFNTGQPVKWVEYFEPTNQYLSMTSIPIGDDYFISTGEDITQRIKNEEALKASERKYRNIAENFPGMVLRYKLNPDGSDELLYISKGVEVLYEIPQSTALSDNNLLWERVHKDDLKPFADSVAKSAKVLSLWEFEHRLLFPDGRIKWIFTSGVPVKHDDGSIVWDSYALDITESKNAKVELEILNTNLENRVKERTRELEETQSQLVLSEKMASIGVLTSGIAHEINNPLNYILGGYAALQNYLNETDQPSKGELNEYLDWIKEGAERAASIVKSLNLISSENRGIDEKCDVKLIADNCLTFLQHRYKDRIKVVKDYSSEDSIIIGNSGNLHQVLLNILSNAFESIENDGYVEVQIRTVNSHAEITIRDSGCGIQEELIDKVADPFFTTKPPGKGVGLGLSIAKSIISQHGGDLRIDSNTNSGTTVTIQLPKKHRKEH